MILIPVILRTDRVDALGALTIAAVLIDPLMGAQVYSPSGAWGTNHSGGLDRAMGSILCEHCTAACCRYIALPLDKPRTPRDYDDIRWYLMHQNILVFVEDGDWYIQFQTRCKNLAPDNRCGIYETRPEICREYEPGECDYAGGAYDYEHLFTHPQQIDEYYEKKTGRSLQAALAARSRQSSERTRGRARIPTALRKPCGI